MEKNVMNTLSIVFFRVLSRLQAEKIITCYISQVNNTYTILAPGSDAPIKIFLSFDGNQSSGVNIHGKKNITIICGALFSLSDEGALFRLLRKAIKKKIGNRVALKTALDSLVSQDKLKKYELSIYQNKLVYTIFLSHGLKQKISFVPKFKQISNSRIDHTKKFPKGEYGFHHLNYISFGNDIYLFLRKWVGGFSRGFDLERVFQKRFNKRKKNPGIFFDFVKTSNEQEVKGFGDFSFTFLGPSKIYLDLKSSQMSVREFIEKTNGITEKKGIAVFPINYKACLEKKV